MIELCPAGHTISDPEGARENGMIVGFFPATTMPDADWWQALWPDPPKVLVEMGVAPGMVAIDGFRNPVHL
jgi:hypothetical protein